jgi:short/branched chain acyl-CoA dehydrogenase
MGLETPGEYGGAECSFTAAILAVEELAKIDPSISALCDIHVSLFFFRNHTYTHIIF